MPRVLLITDNNPLSGHLAGLTGNAISFSPASLKDAAEYSPGHDLILAMSGLNEINLFDLSGMRRVLKFAGEQLPGVPLVFLSWLNRADHPLFFAGYTSIFKQRALDFGHAHWIILPVSEEELLNQLNNLIPEP